MSLERGRDAALDPADRRPIERIRALGYLLDEAVQVPGTRIRIGADPILGILPVAGDLLAAIASLYIVRVGVDLGVPRRAVAGMLLRIGAEFAVGSIPLLGPVADAGWKVNVRNVAVIEEHVAGSRGD